MGTAWNRRSGDDSGGKFSDRRNGSGSTGGIDGTRILAGVRGQCKRKLCRRGSDKFCVYGSNDSGKQSDTDALLFQGRHACGNGRGIKAY